MVCVRENKSGHRHDAGERHDRRGRVKKPVHKHTDEQTLLQIGGLNASL